MKDLSHLPTGDKGVGYPPDANPIFAPALAEAWASTLDDGSKPHASPTSRIRHSWAGMCARKIGYEVLGVPASNPITIADRHRFGIGTMIHELWQDAMKIAFPNAKVEVKVVIPECESSGHIDLVLDREGQRLCMELKSINGYGFKMAIGSRGPAEGPRTSAILQGALNAEACEADVLVIVYLSLENLSPREAIKMGPEEWRKFSAEWSYSKDEYQLLAEREITRFKAILSRVDNGELPPRHVPIEMPMGARIIDPSSGKWTRVEDDGSIVEAGSFWGCNYCSHQGQCITDG